MALVQSFIIAVWTSCNFISISIHPQFSSRIVFWYIKITIFWKCVGKQSLGERPPTRQHQFCSGLRVLKTKGHMRAISTWILMMKNNFESVFCEPLPSGLFCEDFQWISFLENLTIMSGLFYSRARRHGFDDTLNNKTVTYVGTKFKINTFRPANDKPGLSGIIACWLRRCNLDTGRISWLSWMDICFLSTMKNIHSNIPKCR